MVNVSTRAVVAEMCPAFYEWFLAVAAQTVL
jgi:hypothetical protein